MYAITAEVKVRHPDGYDKTFSVPTFYLDEHVQGILSEDHAVRIAREIIDPAGLLDMVYIIAVFTSWK